MSDVVLMELGAVDDIRERIKEIKNVDHPSNLAAVDVSTGLYYQLDMDNGKPCVVSMQGQYTVKIPINHTTPFTWAKGDKIVLHYPVY